ncbi:hypothetical protein QYF61_021881 [Mycteria americana]|uniref:Uncharacterized protein n=1 Tax=Mycteria americana TaxID=33587 RepID=A0AAN7SA25_MYCAM|nr:hypothetical protein QYF61_021881 [Mycteria americana]
MGGGTFKHQDTHLAKATGKTGKQVMNEDVKQYCPQCQPLDYTNRNWPPAGLRATDHNPLSPIVQPVFSPLQCPLI